MKLLDHIREWAVSYTKEKKYSPVGIWFHWIMAALVLFQLGLGWIMERFFVGGEKLSAYWVHAAIGLTILFLAIWRGLWRLFIPDPVNDSGAPEWQHTVAHGTQYAFYTLFAILPLSGWAMWSAIQPAQPLSLAGIVAVPPMPFYDLSPAWQYWVMTFAESVHVAGVWALSLFLPLHVGAALKHHFWNRDDVVRGILPDIPDDETSPGAMQHNPQEA
ncbi:cytochrome b [Altericroceibacterium xinjiangense]|uniref:cytochrome b n=1 Tax=Altericroceibacterium xinjiangense TaxID=762261 RepID=UPI000F7D9D27|nr:cytochrome b [Altericroceibacterium xinjiangense]